MATIQSPAARYPIARSAHEILTSCGPDFLYRASKEREAASLVGFQVAFVSEFIGDPFQDRDAALDRYKGLVDDDRPDSRFTPKPDDRFYHVVCRFKRPVGRPARRKTQPPEEGRRWGAPEQRLEVFYQLSVSYWKILDRQKDAASTPLPAGATKKSRRRQKFSTEDLQRIANTPLYAPPGQLPLLFGLFEPPGAKGLQLGGADE